MCHGFSYGLSLSVVSGHGGAGGHIYYQDSATSLPCAFEFIGDHRLAWFFDVQSLKEGPQAPELFSVPHGCASNPCPKAPAKGGQDAAAGRVRGDGGGEAPGASGSARPGNFEGLVDEVVGLVENS